MTVKAYQHYATEPDRVMPVVMCSFCNEQNLIVSHAEYQTESGTRPIIFRCRDCDYVWELDFTRLKWDGYSLEGGKWDED